jgi:hypothetical protein
MSLPRSYLRGEYGVSPEGDLTIPLPAWIAQLACGFAGPSAEEIRMLLLDLGCRNNWRRVELSVLLGVSTHTLRRWEEGERHPSAAARKLIWLMHVLLHEPEILRTTLDIMLWGQTGIGKEEPQTTEELPPKP